MDPLIRERRDGGAVEVPVGPYDPAFEEVELLDDGYELGVRVVHHYF